jgi:Protein of unknown function (DUF3168)
MAMIAAAALQASIHARLIGDAAVTSLLGGPKVHDRTPPEEAFPYVTFGASASQDWSTGTDRGDEHLVTLNVWSRQQGKKQVLDIAGAILTSLETAALAPAGHRIVLLRTIGVDANYDTALRGYRAAIRLEALTEVI